MREGEGESVPKKEREVSLRNEKLREAKRRERRKEEEIEM